MPTIQEKFMKARTEMSSALIERDGEIDLVLTGLICHEHPLLVGPPGTAKSYLIDNLLNWMGGSVKKFPILFTKFTTPEELFGPISVNGMKNDVYRRVPTGMLQEAHLGFGDEIFKASPAILGTLLKILNEGKYVVGDGTEIKVPLIQFLAASNEFPQEQELGALFDRFLLRKKVRPIATSAGNKRLLMGALSGKLKPKFSTTITPKEIAEAKLDSEDLDFSPEAWEALYAILAELQKEGIRPGDRRRFKSIRAVQAFAWLCGEEVNVQTEHLEILAHTFWDDPTEQPEKCAKIVAKIANPLSMAINDAITMADSIYHNTAKTFEQVAIDLDKIQTDLKKFKTDPRRDRALVYIGQLRKQNFARVNGVQMEVDI